MDQGRDCIQGVQGTPLKLQAPHTHSKKILQLVKPLPLRQPTNPGSGPMAAQECQVMPLPFQVAQEALGAPT
jgi:hypothetical protein